MLITEVTYLGGADHEVGLNLSCYTLEEGLLMLLDGVGGVLGRDGDNGYREGDCLCVN